MAMDWQELAAQPLWVEIADKLQDRLDMTLLELMTAPPDKVALLQGEARAYAGLLAAPRYESEQRLHEAQSRQITEERMNERSAKRQRRA